MFVFKAPWRVRVAGLRQKACLALGREEYPQLPPTLEALNSEWKSNQESKRARSLKGHQTENSGRD